MSSGPGKYDEATTIARELTGAQAVILVVVGGSRGHGFEVQTRDPSFRYGIPGILRDMAEQIEADNEKRGGA